MADWTQFSSRPILADFTVDGLDANGSITSGTSGTVTKGTNGSISVTPGSVNSTAVPTGYAWDALEMEIISPQASDGTSPDATVTILNGTTNLQETLYIDGSNKGNMFPYPTYTKGLQRLVFGFSARDLLTKAINRGGVSNLPLKMTGLKVTESLRVTVASTAGWSSPKVPMRIIIRGDILSDATLRELDRAPYDGTIDLSIPGFPRYQNVHVVNGPISQNWSALPGGVHQGSVKVNRRITFAYNNAQVPANGQLILSQLNALRGNDANVVASENDLGDYFKNTNNAFLWQEFGVNLYAAGAVANIAMVVDGTNVPQDTVNGTYASFGHNDFAYGAIATNGQGPNTSSEYLRVGPATRLGQFLAFQNGVVPAIASGNSTAITANQVSVVKGGVLISQG